MRWEDIVHGGTKQKPYVKQHICRMQIKFSVLKFFLIKQFCDEYLAYHFVGIDIEMYLCYL